MWKFALRNLLSRPVRSLLSLLGLTVAIAGMVGLFSVAEGLDQTINTTFDRIPGLLAMQPGAPIPLFSTIPADWEAELSGMRGVDVVNAEIWKRVNVIDGKMIVSPPRFLFGTDIRTRVELSSDPYQQDMLEGRFLDESDIGTFNTVISQPIADEFQKGVGETLVVNGFELTIIGIYHCHSLLLDVAVILDIDQVRQMSRESSESVSSYYIEPNGQVSDEALVDAIRERFRDRGVQAWSPSTNPLQVWADEADAFLKSLSASAGGVDGDAGPAPPVAPEQSPPEQPGAESDSSSSLEVRTVAEWADRFEELSGDLDLFLGVLTAIGVIVAILSIVNTMLMSVSERLIEFGILKANGWSRKHVLQLIACESGVLGFAGGILGSVIGWIATLIVNANWPDRVQLFASPGLLTFSVVFATILGLLAGLYPALWAMRMQPMDAIRRS